LKKYLEYLGLLVLACFSFYYTEKVTKIMNSKDPIMINIEEYNKANSTSCKEGYITSDGVVLGVSGKAVDVEASYMEMQGYGYDESLMVFEDITCKVNKENTTDKYIIKGNEAKNSVSIFININDGSLLKEIVGLADYKGVKINLITTGSVLETFKKEFEEIYASGHEIVYGGIDNNDLKKYMSIVKEFNKKPAMYCIDLGIKDTLAMCNNEKINSLKTNNIFTKDILLNTKKSLEKGEFLVYKENKNTVNELSATINYIVGKQIKIVNISEMLS